MLTIYRMLIIMISFSYESYLCVWRGCTAPKSPCRTHCTCRDVLPCAPAHEPLGCWSWQNSYRTDRTGTAAFPYVSAHALSSCSQHCNCSCSRSTGTASPRRASFAYASSDATTARNSSGIPGSWTVFRLYGSSNAAWGHSPVWCCSCTPYTCAPCPSASSFVWSDHSHWAPF